MAIANSENAIEPTRQDSFQDDLAASQRATETTTVASSETSGQNPAAGLFGSDDGSNATAKNDSQLEKDCDFVQKDTGNLLACLTKQEIRIYRSNGRNSQATYVRTESNPLTTAEYSLLTQLDKRLVEKMLNDVAYPDKIGKGLDSVIGFIRKTREIGGNGNRDERIEAIYAWITANIAYDKSSLFQLKNG